MSSSFKDFGSQNLSILNGTEDNYWQYSRKGAAGILLYTEKSSIYEPPTKEKFREGSDVLVRWTDGLLYLGNIIKVEEEFSRCAIKFEDGSQYWSLYKDIHKGPPSNNEIICTVCDAGTSDPPDEIVICDRCSVGYHQFCHIPKIDSSVLKPEVAWSCRKCVFANCAKKGGALKKGSKAQAMQIMKQTLPYDLHSLTWDVPHRSNLQQTYCYCGGPGEWYMKMLQCLRCKQWFHEACLQCLEEPLLFGDRFYVFICAICNKGPEFIRRLALRWPDIAHLVLFNLTILYGKKYFDLDSTIMNFLKDKWSQLQVKGEELSRSTFEEKKQKMVETFQSNKSRFISGKEIRRKTAIWGLRSRVPPPVPVVIIPDSVPITDSVLDSFKPGKKSRSQVKAENTPIPMKRKRKPPLQEQSKEEGQNEQRNYNDACDTSSQNSAVQPSNEEVIVADKPRTKKLQKRRRRTRSARKFSPQSPLCDLSDSDDTSSSHDTLNSIIPHPNNFEGLNNPFIIYEHSPCSKSDSQKSSSASSSSQSSGGSSKRTHRLRHLRSSQSSSNTTSVINLIGARRTTNNNNSELVRKSLDSSVSRSDLNTSMDNYFGAENRIADGEKFNVLGKRIAPDGRVQYLIEWESFSS